MIIYQWYIYIWIRIGEKRIRQYKAQRAADAIQQLAFDQGKEQRGSLRWCTKIIKMEESLPAEAQLTVYEQPETEKLKRIEVHTRHGSWWVDEAEANYWLDRMRMFINDDRTWVFRNGLIWNGVTIRMGDVYWVEGCLPEPPMRARTLLRERPVVWWKNNTPIAGQIL
jgi:hypothetical protein